MLERPSEEASEVYPWSTWMNTGIWAVCSGPKSSMVSRLTSVAHTSRDEDTLSSILKILRGNYSKRKRNNFILYDGKLVPYPFENGIYKLPADERVMFVKGILERMLFIAKNEWQPSNFMEWVKGIFGDYMAKEYLIPYNAKIWKRPLESMAADWVFTPGRLPLPELEEIVRAAAGIPSVGYKEQAYFYYPRRGGIHALFQSLYEEVSLSGAKFIGGERVEEIRRKRDDTYEINGMISAKRIISTIPLPELLLAVGGTREIRRLAEGFDWNGVVVVGVALPYRSRGRTTIYVPDHKVIFHRYTWMSSLVPPRDPGKGNLIAEITVPKGEQPDMDRITEDTVRGLANVGAIRDERDVIFTRAWLHKYGYPIYSMNHNEIRSKAMQMLGEVGIHSIGRWGSWHYWNTDMVYKAVMES